MATVDAATEIKYVEVEPLTPEAFAPFGDVLTVEGRERLPIDLYSGVDVFRADFHTNRPMEWTSFQKHSSRLLLRCPWQINPKLHHGCHYLNHLH